METLKRDTSEQDSENPEKRYNIAAEKFWKVGPLGVTAKDHHDIGSTPPDFMEEQPNKTMAELMTDEQIREWLEKNSPKRYKKSSIEYLKSIGRSIRNHH